MIFYGEQEIKDMAQKYQACQDPKEIWWLYEKVRSINPHVVVEIGIYNGGALKVWATIPSNSGDLVIGIDCKFDNWKQFGGWDLNSGVAPVKLIDGDSHSQETVSKLKGILGDRKIDFLFIDGDHSEKGTKADYELYESIVSIGGIIGLHDLNDGGTQKEQINGPVNVKGFWEKLKHPRKESYFSSLHDDTGYGIGCITKTKYNRIVITGSDGVIGSELKSRFPSKNVLCISRHGNNPVDIRNFDEIERRITEFKPDIIFHFAAITDVDWCEKNEQDCLETNVDATANICRIAVTLDVPIVYASTFYVYGGGKETPYDDSVDIPDISKITNIYTKSKFLGEKEVEKHCKKFFILRFGAIFGGGEKDKKFVGKILKTAKENFDIKAVCDRKISLSYSKDIISNIYPLIDTDRYGVYNMVNQGGINYYEYASKIIEYAGLKNRVTAIKSEVFDEDAFRGKNLVVLNSKLKNLGVDMMRPWEIALKEYIEDLKRNKFIWMKPWERKLYE